MDWGWALARWKGTEKFCRAINNHGGQHTGEGNQEEKKRNREEITERRVRGKKTRQSRMSQRRHGKEENENFGKRGPSSNKINLSEGFWFGSSEYQSRIRHYRYVQYEQLHWKSIWASVLVTKATNKCRGGLPETTLALQRQNKSQFWKAANVLFWLP